MTGRILDTGPTASDIILLGNVLAIAPSPAETSALRRRLYGEAGLTAGLVTLAARLRLTPALVHRMLARGLAPPQQTQAAANLNVHWTRHLDRRSTLAGHLQTVIGECATIGTRPLLLKGAQALWTGEPPWRSLRDLDLLVPYEAADRVQDALLALDYRPRPGRIERRRRHHLEPLYRGDLPGWIELHRRAGNPWCERLLPTAELVVGAREAAAVPGPETGRTVPVALVLPAHLSILHALVHHHIGHSAYARGAIDPKGLYEFAAATAVCGVDDLSRLTDRAAGHPRLAAALDRWVAAAHRLYAMPVRPPLRLAADSLAQFDAVMARYDRPSRWPYPGYADEIAAAWSKERLRGLRGGTRVTGRIALRIRAATSLMPSLRR